MNATRKLGYSIADSGSVPKEFRILGKTLKLTSEGATNFAEVCLFVCLFSWRYNLFGCIFTAP